MVSSINKQAFYEKVKKALLPYLASYEKAIKLADYLLTLKAWNRVFNLTAVNDLEQMIIYHLIDSLVICPYIKGERILDVGTGAGLPGIVLAVVYPDKVFYLLDSNGKKTRFLRAVKNELKLDNVEIINERAEHFQDERKFDMIVSRAVASIENIIANTRQLINKNGQYLFMKGKYPIEELVNYQAVANVQPLDIPAISADRHAVIIKGSDL